MSLVARESVAAFSGARSCVAIARRLVPAEVFATVPADGVATLFPV